MTRRALIAGSCRVDGQEEDDRQKGRQDEYRSGRVSDGDGLSVFRCAEELQREGVDGARAVDDRSERDQRGEQRGNHGDNEQMRKRSETSLGADRTVANSATRKSGTR